HLRSIQRSLVLICCFCGKPKREKTQIYRKKYTTTFNNSIFSSCLSVQRRGIEPIRAGGLSSGLEMQSEHYLSAPRNELVGVPRPVTSSYPGVEIRLRVWFIVRRR